MKKLLLLILVVTLNVTSQAQDKVYLLIEFMRVDNEQGADYWETETFWSKIHQERAKAGEIMGWDLWSLTPGGEDQGYQFATVHQYNDPVKMMEGGGNLMAHAKKAHPNMSEYELQTKLRSSAKTRDLAARVFLEVVDATDDSFKMKVGMITSIDLMKVEMDNYQAYEKAEKEVFKPMHQQQVEAGTKGSWSLARVMFPFGSDTYGTHMTFNFFNDWKQSFDSWNNDGGQQSADMQKKIQAGLKTRDLKYSYMGKLEMMVRP